MSEESLDKVEAKAAKSLAAFLAKLYGKCPDFDENCTACQRWLAFNCLFPAHAVKWKRPAKTTITPCFMTVT